MIYERFNSRGSYVYFYYSPEDELLATSHIWNHTNGGYACATIDGKTAYFHRLVLEKLFGELDKNEQANHIDGNPHNNRRDNLEIVTPATNQLKKGIQSNNSTGHKGVSYHISNKAYQAYCGSCGYLGYFRSIDKAISARAKHMLIMHKVDEGLK